MVIQDDEEKQERRTSTTLNGKLIQIYEWEISKTNSLAFGSLVKVEAFHFVFTDSQKHKILISSDWFFVVSFFFFSSNPKSDTASPLSAFAVALWSQEFQWNLAN